MTRQPARILLADDHAMVRSGLRMILDAEPDLQVVAEAANGYEAIDALAHTPTDLAILDIAMPRMTGLQAAREITRSHPHVRILILSMYDNEQYFFEALKAGASGYVLKSVADRDLLEACRATAGRTLPLRRRGHRPHPRLPAPSPARRIITEHHPHPPRRGNTETDRRRRHHPRNREHLEYQRQNGRPAPRKHPEETRTTRQTRPDPIRNPFRTDRAVIVVLPAHRGDPSQTMV